MKVDTCFARQPIFDTSERVAAYEVLYRSAGTRTAVFDDPVGATMAVLDGAFGDIDRVDRLDGLVGYVNMPREVLFGDTVMSYSPRRLGVEVLEDVEPDGLLISALADLRKKGYRVALDDFMLGGGRDLLLTQADIVKVDVLEHDDDQLGRTAETLRSTGLILLAEKVETRESLARCQSLGFELFQGYFFARPEMMSGSTADRHRHVVAMLTDLHRHVPDASEVARAIDRYPALARSLLAVLNSPIIGLPRAISSVQVAVDRLGTARIIELATAVALSDTPQVAPELVNLALTRARMCESMAVAAGRADPLSYFSAGVLSVLDALSDLPMEDVLADAPVPGEIAEALTSRTGDKGEALAATLAYERARWEDVSRHGFDLDVVSNAYFTAIDWSSRMTVLTRSFT